MSIERTIADIGDRDALHKWVYKLPEGSRAIVLVEFPDGYTNSEGDSATHSFKSYGNPTLAQLLWVSRSFEHYLFGNTD